LTVLCVTPHADDIEALPSLRLCRGCRDGLRRDLAALPGLWADLAAALPAGSSPRYGRVSGSSSHPLPINIAAANHRNQIARDLTELCVTVATRRGLIVPVDHIIDRRGRIRAAYTEPPVTAPWLLRHVDWIAAQPDTAETCPEVMRGLVGRARALVAPSGARRIAIGPCRGSRDGQACFGTLYATVRAEDDTRPSVIYCNADCGTEITTEQWRRFGREYLREGRMAG
jgi:hypothetical protein